MYGIFIGKVELRTFDGSRSFSVDSSSLWILSTLDDRHPRGELNFTFRDSVKDSVNVAYWLPPKDLIIISSKFSTGDVGREIRRRVTCDTLLRSDQCLSTIPRWNPKQMRRQTLTHHGRPCRYTSYFCSMNLTGICSLGLSNFLWVRNPMWKRSKVQRWSNTNS